MNGHGHGGGIYDGEFFSIIEKDHIRTGQRIEFMLGGSIKRSFGVSSRSGKIVPDSNPSSFTPCVNGGIISIASTIKQIDLRGIQFTVKKP